MHLIVYFCPFPDHGVANRAAVDGDPATDLDEITNDDAADMPHSLVSFPFDVAETLFTDHRIRLDDGKTSDPCPSIYGCVRMNPAIFTDHHTFVYIAMCTNIGCRADSRFSSYYCKRLNRAGICQLSACFNVRESRYASPCLTSGKCFQ